jgi:hypothetical protein
MSEKDRSPELGRDIEVEVMCSNSGKRVNVKGTTRSKFYTGRMHTGWWFAEGVELFNQNSR